MKKDPLKLFRAVVTGAAELAGIAVPLIAAARGVKTYEIKLECPHCGKHFELRPAEPEK